MRIIRAEEVDELSAAVPLEAGRLSPHWLEGPVNSDRLDVGLVTVARAAPPHPTSTSAVR